MRTERDDLLSAIMVLVLSATFSPSLCHMTQKYPWLIATLTTITSTLKLVNVPC